jgi:hypothetical protein
LIISVTAQEAGAATDGCTHAGVTGNGANGGPTRGTRSATSQGALGSIRHPRTTDGQKTNNQD